MRPILAVVANVRIDCGFRREAEETEGDARRELLGRHVPYTEELKLLLAGTFRGSALAVGDARGSTLRNMADI